MVWWWGWLESNTVVRVRQLGSAMVVGESSVVGGS